MTDKDFVASTLRSPESTISALLRYSGYTRHDLTPRQALQAIHEGIGLAILRASYSANAETVNIYELADGTWYVLHFDGERPVVAGHVEIRRECSSQRAWEVYFDIRTALDAGCGLTTSGLTPKE